MIFFNFCQYECVYVFKAMELLVSGVMQSAGSSLSPSEALRRVCEAVAGGLLLEHGPGLRDPCEKELVVCTLLLATAFPKQKNHQEPLKLTG